MVSSTEKKKIIFIKAYFKLKKENNFDQGLFKLKNKKKLD
jgi:hypothetical protein